MPPAVGFLQTSVINIFLDEEAKAAPNANVKTTIDKIIEIFFITFLIKWMTYSFLQVFGRYPDTDQYIFRLSKSCEDFDSTKSKQVCLVRER